MGVQHDVVEIVGGEYEVEIHYTTEYRMRVKAPTEHMAVEEADLRRFADDMDPCDYDLVHSRVEPVRDIFEDDPDAYEVCSWIDGPSAPSEDTYWDDSVHFGDGPDV